jgi:hypothetical protein
MVNHKQRIGAAILRVLAEHAIKSIPVVGPYLEVGWDLIVAVREEVSKDVGRGINTKEMSDALKSLTYTEAAATVDGVLGSPQGKDATAGLSDAQRRQFRRTLIAAPSEFDSIFSDIARSDHEATLKAAEEKRSKMQTLKQALKQQMEAREFEKAWDTADSITALDPSDMETLKVQEWLEKRLKKSIWKSTLAGFGGTYLFFIIFGVIANALREQPHPDPGDAVTIIALICGTIGGVVGFSLAVKRKLTRRWHLRKGARLN